jgi:transcription elongation GreA/GreB family factor
MRTTNRASELKHHIPMDPHISQKKYDQLVARLDVLKKKKPILAKEVTDLATLGDFSENFEYQQAKHELRRVTNQIIKLQHRIDSAVIIEAPESGVVGIGSTVTVVSSHTGEQKTYTILGSSEIALDRGIISHTSPIGEALIGSRVGEQVQIVLPTKTITVQVVEVV